MSKQSNNILINTYNSGNYLNSILTKHSFFNTEIAFENKHQYMSRSVKPLVCGRFPIYQKHVFSEEVLYNISSFPISLIYVNNAEFLKSSLQIDWKYKNKTLLHWQPLSSWKTFFSLISDSTSLNYAKSFSYACV